MTAYVIFDVEIRDIPKYQELMMELNQHSKLQERGILRELANTRSIKEMGNREELLSWSSLRWLQG